MSSLIACFIAGICAAGFVTIWFTTVYAELSVKRNCLADIDEQLRLHEKLYAQTWDGPDARSSAYMLETSRLLLREALKSYNCILRKPMNRVPALIMGFRTMDEENMQDFELNYENQR